MIMKFSPYYLFLLLILFLGCNAKNEIKSQFTSLKPQETNIFFQNNLTEAKNSNVLLYEYFYNGGGVAISDFNGDEKLDIYLSSNMEENKLYLNRGNFKFEDISDISNTKGINGPWKTGVTAVDINSDGRMDIYVCYSGKVKDERRKNQLFLNMGNNEDGTPIFTEVAGLYGLDSAAYSNQGYFFDYDKDGDLDMLLLNHNPNSLPVLGVPKTKVLLKEDQPLTGLRLYEQRERYFYDVTAKKNINGSSLSYGLGIALSDFNNDGWIDFYVSNDYTIPDYLYINNKSGDFENKLQESMSLTSHFSMGNDTSDINNDGHIDLMTLDMLPEDNKRQKLLQAPDNYNLFDLNIKSGFHFQYMRNMLQINNGNGTFSEVGQMMGVSNTDWSWAALFADFNNDGWQDLFVSNGYKRDYTNRDFLNYMENFIDNKNSNINSKDVLEIINNMPSSNVSNYIYKNQKGKDFKNVTESWGIKSYTNSNGAAYGDLDGDGDLDLVVNNINAPIGMYRNNGNNSKNYLQVKLEGDKNNLQAIGARVNLYHSGKQQSKEQFPTRGYLSTVSPILHFGVGEFKKIDSLEVRWGNGKISIQKQVDVNQTITLNHKDAEIHENIESLEKTLFERKTNTLEYTHQVKDILDFNRQRLLHYQPSYEGPVVIKGDLNQDKRDDLIIGGGKGQEIKVWIQQLDGKFKQKVSSDFIKNKEGVITGLELFDVDLDGDLDLFASYGGYHNFNENSEELSDAIYINSGNGEFKKTKKVFAKQGSGVAKSTDLNQDGSPDIFVAGSIIPGSYPYHFPNKLLLNDGSGNLIIDQDNSETVNEVMGIVKDALWIDLNFDGLEDLILVGEWMPITVFLNQKGKLKKQSNYFSTKKTQNGWWNTIEVGDFNNDGHVDLIIGNEGTNNAFNSSLNHPVQIHFDDFDQNGSVDPILSYYIQGKSYPLATRDEILGQWVALKSTYPSYESYAKTDLESLLKDHITENTKIWKATEMRSMLLMSQKDGYKIQYLPDEVQRSPLKSIVISDLNLDGNQDLILAGNRTENALKIGRNEANYGTILLGDGKGDFKTLPTFESGLIFKGSVSSMLEINNTLYIGRCNEELMIFSRNEN